MIPRPGGGDCQGVASKCAMPGTIGHGREARKTLTAKAQLAGARKHPLAGLPALTSAVVQKDCTSGRLSGVTRSRLTAGNEVSIAPSPAPPPLNGMPPGDLTPRSYLQMFHKTRLFQSKCTGRSSGRWSSGCRRPLFRGPRPRLPGAPGLRTGRGRWSAAPVSAGLFTLSHGSRQERVVIFKHSIFSVGSTSAFHSAWVNLWREPPCLAHSVRAAGKGGPPLQAHMAAMGSCRGAGAGGPVAGTGKGGFRIWGRRQVVPDAEGSGSLRGARKQAERGPFRRSWPSGVTKGPWERLPVFWGPWLRAQWKFHGQ